MSVKKVFVDSNVWLYLLGSDAAKKEVALNLLAKKPTISTQVLTENANICLRKLGLGAESTEKHLDFLQKHCKVQIIRENTVAAAVTIHQKYAYSLYDSLIIAAALECGCTELLTEDLQKGQIIEQQLVILNPF